MPADMRYMSLVTLNGPIMHECRINSSRQRRTRLSTCEAEKYERLLFCKPIVDVVRLMPKDHPIGMPEASSPGVCYVHDLAARSP